MVFPFKRYVTCYTHRYVYFLPIIKRFVHMSSLLLASQPLHLPLSFILAKSTGLQLPFSEIFVLPNVELPQRRKSLLLLYHLNVSRFIEVVRTLLFRIAYTKIAG